MSERKKAIIVMGPTGQGKSSFINALTGSELEVSHTDLSCTDDVTVVDYRDGVIIDTPGVGDVRLGQKKLSNEEIFRMIVLKCNEFKVIGFVCMVGVEQLTSRQDSNLFDLIVTLNTRFTNFFLLIQYGFKDAYGMITKMVLTEAAIQNKKKYKKLNLRLEDIYMCKKLDFTDLIRAVDEKFNLEDPLFLEPSGYVLKCTQCKAIGDPLTFKEKCRRHPPGDIPNAKHTELERYHRTMKIHRFHTGYRKKSFINKYWTCCDAEANDEGCKIGFTCCNLNNEGCRVRCINCRRDAESPGCTGYCKSCKEPLSTRGCMVKERHNFLPIANSWTH
eukprot:snap_masked-scaffold_48-processed-gene-1.81-mRNA-1 protein AED:1.00 eAED:1.00 QI:0/-1/0/0/-1/1/1/0/331